MPRKQWEYLTVLRDRTERDGWNATGSITGTYGDGSTKELNSGHTKDALMQTLTDLGRDGWELIETHERSGSGWFQTSLWLKRRINDDE